MNTGSVAVNIRRRLDHLEERLSAVAKDPDAEYRAFWEGFWRFMQESLFRGVALQHHQEASGCLGYNNGLPDGGIGTQKIATNEAVRQP
jgi:hypothetical protein